MVGAGPGQRQAVKGAGAATNLIHQYQAVGTGIVQDVGGFCHFDHKGRAAAGEVVRRADAGEDAIEKPHLHFGCGYKAANLGEDDDQCRLPHIGGFSSHIWAGDDQHTAGVMEQGVIGYEGVVQYLLDHQVATFTDR